MLVCHGCHRHVRISESACPFCGAAITLAPAPVRLGAMALAVGLSLLGCSGDDGQTPETTTMETNSTTMTTDMTGTDTESSGTMSETTMGESMTGDGDGDSGGADYGGAPPPDPSWER